MRARLTAIVSTAPLPRDLALGLLALRVVAGLFLAAHGWMKLDDFAGFADKVGGVGPALGAIAGELGGGLGLALGLLTRPAGFGVAAVMGYIAFAKHGAGLAEIGTGAGTSFEYPFLLATIGALFMVVGAGPHSLDRLLAERLGR